MKKKLFFLAAVLIFTTLGFSHTSSTAKQSETVDTREIMKTIEKSYEIEREALYTGDFSKFPAVFINDPRFNVSPYTLRTVQDLTNNHSLKSAGWLDYKMAYWNWRVNGALHAEAILAKAKSEKRDLTKEEKASFVDQDGRIAPPRTSKEKYKYKKIDLEFTSVNINGDIATAVLDEGPRTIKLTLIRVDKKWYIAASETLTVNV